MTFYTMTETDNILKELDKVQNLMSKMLELLANANNKDDSFFNWPNSIQLYSDWLKANKISQKYFCQQIGKNESDIGQVLKGQRKLSRPTKALFRLFKENYEFKQIFNQ